jgi:16S rRNA (cytosine967-C5)-methyltransferase
VTARQLALHLLQAWPKTRRLADELLQDAFAKHPFSGPERSLAQDLFYGCLRHRLALDYLVQQQARQSPRPVVHALLHLGLYQLHYLQLAPHAAVHETVELAKHHASAAETKFINAVLRRADPALLANAEPWVRLSHPRWLWERHGDAWCEWNNQPPPVFVRLNPLGGATSRRDRDHLEPTAHPLCFRLVDPAGFFDSAAWKNGEFYVQDPSTLLAVDALDPQPGETILDMCAAPGGKTTYIAAKMQNRGQIVAADSSNVRLGLVAENCRRLGVTIVATLPCEGTRLDRCLRGSQFDRVLLDAPCSNTGVMRRRPDLRWRIQPAEIHRLAALQRKLLAVAAQFVKPGGILVYSTCSVEPEENEAVAQPPPGFTLVEQRATCPPAGNMDGAFYSKMRAA